MSKIADNLHANINVGLYPILESTVATVRYLSESGCRLSMTSKLSENVKSAASRDADFWLKLVKAQLRINAIYAVKTGMEVTIYGLPHTDKGEPSELANITLSDRLSKSYPDDRLRKLVVQNLMRASL